MWTLLWLGCGTSGLDGKPKAALVATLPMDTLSQAHAERLDPALGQTIQIDLAYAGPWPAALSWEGVDQADGTRAWVTPTLLGEAVIRVDGAQVVLDVQPARNRPDLLPLPIGKRQVPAADHACFDPRFPKLSGPWILACEGDTTHRVAAPPADDPRRNTARTSSPIAIYLSEQEVLSVLPGLGEPKYDDVTAIDFHVGVMCKYYGEEYRQTGED